jgi:hypothetical protein
MPLIGAAKDIQYLQARKRRLQTHILKLGLIVHVVVPWWLDL